MPIPNDMIIPVIENIVSELVSTVVGVSEIKGMNNDNVNIIPLR
jgi:hypothetical protein